MDFRQLEFFVAIVEEGGFHRAAAKLFVSEPAISRKIRLLEEELHEKLFLRTSRRVMLTPSGEALLHHCRLAFRHLKDATAQISEIAGLQSGELSIGVGVSDSILLLPPVIRRFQEKFPQIELKVTAGGAEEILPQIKAGRIELGILDLEAIDVAHGDLSFTKILTDELVVAVSPDHPLAGRNRVTADELSHFPFIILSRQYRLGRILEAVFRDMGIKSRLAMELPNYLTIKTMVELNLGVGILPLSIVMTELKSKRLRILRIKGKRLQRELGMVHLRAKSLPRAVSEMISLLKEEFQHVGNI